MNLINLRNFQTLQTDRKLVLWLVLSLALSLVFFREFWTSLPSMLSPDSILSQHQASPWAVLLLCGIFLWLKRDEIWRGMLEGGQVTRLQVGKLEGGQVTRLQVGKLEGWRAGNFINFQTSKLVVGFGLVAGAVLLPSSQDYLVFQVLLASLGVFIILFGRAAKIPAIALAIYGLAITFPLAIERFAEQAYAGSAIAPLMGVMTALGYPVHNEGQWVQFTSSGGEPISVAITAGCAGPVTMGVFLALFALMMLDMPLPPRKAIGLFLFGVMGTWLQSFIRLIILMLVGYHLGEQALWTAHAWTIYLLFPLWYGFFVFIYFRQLRRPVEAKAKTTTPVGTRGAGR